MKKAFYLLFVLVIVGSFSLKAQDKSVTRAKESEKVWVIVNFIKDEAKADYLSWMNTYFFPALKNSKDPVIQKQYQCTRWLEPLHQNADKTWTLAHAASAFAAGAAGDPTPFSAGSSAGGTWGVRCLRHREHLVAPARQLTS